MNGPDIRPYLRLEKNLHELTDVYGTVTSSSSLTRKVSAELSVESDIEISTQMRFICG